MLLHFYIQPERKTEERSCELLAQPLGSTRSIPGLPWPRSLVLAVPPLPRHRGLGGKLQNTAILCDFQNTEETLWNPSFSPVSTGMWFWGQSFLLQLEPGTLGLRGASFRKGTPECRGSLKPLGHKDYRRHQRRQSNSTSASSGFQKHIAKRIILGQSFKDSQVTFPESAGKEGKKRDSEERGIILNHPLI